MAKGTDGRAKVLTVYSHHSIVMRFSYGQCWLMVYRTLAEGQKIIVPNHTPKHQMRMAAEAIEICAVPGSALQKEATFLRSVLLRDKAEVYPASVRVTLANYRKNIKRQANK